MAYKIQKFTNDFIPNPPAGVPERKVYWVANKHKHEGDIITTIKQWLGVHYPPPAPHVGGWDSTGLFMSNQSSPPNDATAVEYKP